MTAEDKLNYASSSFSKISQMALSRNKEDTRTKKHKMKEGPNSAEVWNIRKCDIWSLGPVLNHRFG